jgi:hypothetical protein
MNIALGQESADIKDIALGNKAVSLVWDPSDRQISKTYDPDLPPTMQIREANYETRENAKRIVKLIRLIKRHGGGVIKPKRGRYTEVLEKRWRDKGNPIKLKEFYVYGPGYKRHAELLCHIMNLQETGELAYRDEREKNEIRFIAETILGWRNVKPLDARKKKAFYKRIIDWGFGDVVMDIERGLIPKKSNWVEVDDGSGLFVLVRRNPRGRTDGNISKNPAKKKVVSIYPQCPKTKFSDGTPMWTMVSKTPKHRDGYKYYEFMWAGSPDELLEISKQKLPGGKVYWMGVIVCVANGVRYGAHVLEDSSLKAVFDKAAGYIVTEQPCAGIRPRKRLSKEELSRLGPEFNPAAKKKAAKKATPKYQILINRCQKLWDAYCEKPTKKNLRAVLGHLDKMKGSTSEKVKKERSSCLRVANKEAKRLKL